MNDVTKDLLEALKKCRNRFAFYVEHHLNKGDSVRAEDNAQFVKLANEAIARAEAALAAPQPDVDGWIPWAGGECPVDRYAPVAVKPEKGPLEVGRAWEFDWNIPSTDPLRIAAYQVVKS